MIAFHAFKVNLRRLIFPLIKLLFLPETIGFNFLFIISLIVLLQS